MEENKLEMLVGFLWGYLKGVNQMRIDVMGDTIRVQVGGERHMYSREDIGRKIEEQLRELVRGNHAT